jgi:hypothetical protein
MLQNLNPIRTVFTITLSVSFIFALGALKPNPHVRAGSPPSTAIATRSESTSPPQGAAKASAALRAIHSRYVKAFVESDGFGESRLIRLDDPFRTPIENNGQHYLVRKLELISLQNHDIPVAYVNDFKNPVKNRLKLGSTRPLNDFEKEALTDLSRGEEFRFRTDENQPGCVGAIRAQTSCLECHDAKIGDLLGAFSYELTAIMSQAPGQELSQLVVPALK